MQPEVPAEIPAPILHLVAVYYKRLGFSVGIADTGNVTVTHLATGQEYTTSLKAAEVAGIDPMLVAIMNHITTAQKKSCGRCKYFSSKSETCGCETTYFCNRLDSCAGPHGFVIGDEDREPQRCQHYDDSKDTREFRF